jgi:hypothetical protein
LTLSRSLGRLCASLIFPLHTSMTTPAKYGCWSTFARIFVAERTRHINRLRWHLHRIDASWDPKPRALTTYKHLDLAAERLRGLDPVVARVALDLVQRICSLTDDIRGLTAELDERTNDSAAWVSPGTVEDG